MNAFTEFWLPENCAICDRPPKPLCADCSTGFPFRAHEVMRKGGNGFGPELFGVAVSDYQGPAVQLVHAFKRQGSRLLTRFMAQALAEAVATQLVNQTSFGTASPEQVTLVPVPSRLDSFRRRGFVPAQLLAAAVATRLRSGCAVEARVSNLAKLTRKVQDQALLGLQGRQSNLSGAMSAVPCPATIDAERRRVILIDDVVTTGATLNELHRAVAEAGWEPIFFATFSETL